MSFVPHPATTQGYTVRVAPATPPHPVSGRPHGAHDGADQRPSSGGSDASSRGKSPKGGDTKRLPP
eukprot:6648248-Heterocapsa_arctica.AAC.1